MLRINQRIRAFTFAELVVVLLIIGLFTAIAAPRAASSMSNYRAEVAAYRIVADLDYARRNARTTGANQMVSFDQVGRSYLLFGVADLDRSGNTYTVELSEEPYRLRAVKADFGGTTAVIFDGYGLPDSGGTIKISSGSRAMTVTLDADTGKASVGP